MKLASWVILTPECRLMDIDPMSITPQATGGAMIMP